MDAVIESAWLSSNFPGQSECGDCLLVQPIPAGVLIAVADGLGHGGKAAESCKTAIDEVRRACENHILLIEIVQRCDQALRNKRGAAIAFCILDRQAGSLTWLGIGNVEGRLLSADDEGAVSRQMLLMQAGVVGYKLPELRPATLPIRRDDLLILATDGIRPEFS
ncbi:MAG: SpoIIE family protein phosphatase, partial [Gammaproteobacteria bacterium]|nr:SpoIIE family protein phosphatase [Gammaproteobacteria bacterium]